VHFVGTKWISQNFPCGFKVLMNKVLKVPYFLKVQLMLKFQNNIFDAIKEPYFICNIFYDNKLVLLQLVICIKFVDAKQNFETIFFGFTFSIWFIRSYNLI
jgi:hypothetical protein